MKPRLARISGSAFRLPISFSREVPLQTLFLHPKYIELLKGDDNVWVFYAGVETENVLELYAS